MINKQMWEIGGEAEQIRFFSGVAERAAAEPANPIL